MVGMPTTATRTPASASRRATASPSLSPRQAYRLGLTAALWAGLMATLMFVAVGLVVWASATNDQVGMAQVAHICARWWMLAHGVALPTWAGSGVQVVPLGITALIAGLMVVALVRSLTPVAGPVLGSLPGVASLIAGTCAGYLAVSASIAVVGSATLGQWALTVGVSVLVAALSAAAALGWVALREGSGTPRGWLRRALGLASGATSGVFVLLALGFLLVVVCVLSRASAVQACAAATQAGLLGAVLLALVQVVYLPTLAVWAASVCAGPGFALGMETGVHPWGSSVTDVPLVPVAEAVPRAMPGWALLVLALPVLAGMIAGWVALRVHSTARHRTSYATGAAALGGLGLGVLCLPAGGGLAAGYYSQVGPSAWLVGLAAAAEMALGAAAASRWLGRNRC